jgi:hypothetical protein
MCFRPRVLALSVVAWAFGVVCGMAGTAPAEDTTLLADKLSAMARMRGDGYFATTDEFAAKGKKQLKLLKLVAEDKKASPLTRVMANILIVRVEDGKGFSKAYLFAQSLRALAEKEKKLERQQEYRTWLEQQKKAAEKAAARKRWKKESTTKLQNAVVGTTVTVTTPAGRALKVRRAQKNEYWVRPEGDKRTWKQWKEDLGEDELCLHAYKVDAFAAFFSGELAELGVGNPGGCGSDRTKTVGLYPLPKDVSILKGRVGYFAMLQLILSSRPESSRATGSRDKRAQVSVRDQVTVLKVLGSGKHVDQQLVAVLNAKLDEQLRRQRTPFYHYWCGESYSAMKYLARHKAEDSVPHLRGFLKSVSKDADLPSPLCAQAAGTLAAIGGNEAENALIAASRTGLPRVRAILVTALAKLGTRNARKRLEEMSKRDSIKPIREEARRLLEILKSKAKKK